MPCFRRTLPSLLALACALLAADAAAQRAPLLSLDGTLGGRSGSGGRYESHAGADLDLTLGMAARGGPGTTLAGALSLGAQAQMSMGDGCIIQEDGECWPRLPGFVSLAALAGAQHTTHRGRSVRALAGPVRYLTDSSPDRGSWGLQGRLDAATPLMRHVSLVGSLRGTLLPEFEGSQVRLFGLGLGLRVH